MDRKKLRWNGWGWTNGPDVLGAHADAVWAWIGRTVGVDPLPHTPAPGLDDTALPPGRFDDDLLARLGEIVGPEQVKTDPYERAFHARGKGYMDMLHLRTGRIDAAPDAVVYPQTAEECLALVRFAAENQLAVIPFGGGSSVVGGVTALTRPGQRGVLTIDMTLMDQVIAIDEESLVARVQAGIYGPQLEEALQARGFTLGHYPQSFEFSTLGGWIAPRGAGHQSNKYGKAEEWLVEATLATPGGLWCTQGFPGSAAGPQFRDLVAGSEGALGVITEAVVKLHRVPEVKDYRGYLFMDFAAAVAATRELMQRDVPTAMIRLSDPDETYFYAALKTATEGGTPPLRPVSDRAAEPTEGLPPSISIMLVGLEGERAEVEHALAQCRGIIEQHGGVHMGEELGQTWYKGRFETPYLRDPMLDRGLGVDTLETCTRWSNLVRLHEAVTRAIHDAMAAWEEGKCGMRNAECGLSNAECGTSPLPEGEGQGEGSNPKSEIRNLKSPPPRGICMAHISHCYRDGASLYFTFVFPRDPRDPMAQWWAIKRAASNAILANGGTISHHHGVGTDHREWYEAEIGPAGLETLRAAKRALDPEGILNPGKLLP
ncbi:MAG TPA: FAD-binding oxidoreductase [Candidatus Hydrogenedentes bacterium]|nr:FAD-binding oxidoreductase [Candidatus Hydrogenedentota bacterium]